jgi:hypothetical protein
MIIIASIRVTFRIQRYFPRIRIWSVTSSPVDPLLTITPLGTSPSWVQIVSYYEQFKQDNESVSPVSYHTSHPATRKYDPMHQTTT